MSSMAAPVCCEVADISCVEAETRAALLEISPIMSAMPRRVAL